MEISNKTEVGLYIEKNVVSNRSSYMEEVLKWMEENNLEYHMISKFVPRAIIDKIKTEAVEGNMLRPSLCAQKNAVSLEDFM